MPFAIELRLKSWRKPKPAPAVAPVDKPLRATTRRLRITLSCPSCGRDMAVLPGIVAYCENAECPDALDLCGVTFVLHPLKEPVDVPAPPQ